MKASINSKFLTGPYGGGAQFANGLKSYLEKQSIPVINHLEDADIDIILLVTPFPFLTGGISTYSFMDAYAYQLAHPRVRIIQRVNECDERKGTRHMNSLLLQCAEKSDYVVFIGAWLIPLLQKAGFELAKPHGVIHSGADTAIFNATGKKNRNGQEKLKIATHHWSPGYLKGHDAYQALDRLLGDPAMRQRYEFTYIGSRPKDLEYRNTAFVQPLSGKELADELKKHDVYITASRNDPGPMHPIEAALCGLPILYINSGALPELCEGYGLEFTLENLPQKLDEMRSRYAEFAQALKSYPNTSERMGRDYLELFKRLASAAHDAPKANMLYRACFAIYKTFFALYWKLKRRFIQA